ncbi:MAG: hypothetical protein RML93_04225 [Anaerolineales bacterium]|nr:hypothetical protein [Anaerolineales bacterium]MDW8446484.1 hypothetical protein [Anaerolineales bacterium]
MAKSNEMMTSKKLKLISIRKDNRRELTPQILLEDREKAHHLHPVPITAYLPTTSLVLLATTHACSNDDKP